MGKELEFLLYFSCIRGIMGTTCWIFQAKGQLNRQCFRHSDSGACWPLFEETFTKWIDLGSRW